jgi:ATP sulfurylase
MLKGTVHRCHKNLQPTAGKNCCAVVVVVVITVTLTEGTRSRFTKTNYRANDNKYYYTVINYIIFIANLVS